MTLKSFVIFTECKEVFASKVIELKKARITPAVIRVTDEEPVHEPPYRLPEIERKHLDEIVADFKKVGIVQDSMSPYASPAFLIKKKTTKHPSELTANDKRQANSITQFANSVVILDFIVTTGLP